MKRAINSLNLSDGLLILNFLVLGILGVNAMKDSGTTTNFPRDLVIGICLVAIIIILSIKYFSKVDLVEKFREVLSEQLATNYQMMHKFRDDFFGNVRNKLGSQDSFSTDDFEEIKKEYFAKACNSILTDTRSLFLKYFSLTGIRIGDDLSLSLKLIINAEDAQHILDTIKGQYAETLNKSDIYIVTGYRDPYTWAKRPERSEISHLVYHVKENTTFDEILNENKNCYFCNNLREVYNKGEYKNQNPNWQKSYNSVLAVPILYQQTQQAKIVYGILTLDSLNPYGYDLFNETTTLHILSSSAAMLALMFGYLDTIQAVEKFTENRIQVNSPVIEKPDLERPEYPEKLDVEIRVQNSIPKPENKIKVFLCHSSDDKYVVRNLYKMLSTEDWIEPWLDEEKILPGQDWGLEVDKAVETSDVVIVCLSNKSVTKEGYIQRELKYILDFALEKPEGTIFIIPLRLDDVETPRKLRYLQYVDYFPESSRETSFKRVRDSLKLRFEKVYQQ